MEIAVKLRSLSKKVEDADFSMLLAELTNELADAKLEAANFKARLAACLEENEALKNALNQKSTQTPSLTDGAYSFAGEDGLFCTACFDSAYKKVRVTSLTAAFRAFGKWRCPVCKASLG
jgi:hypothetical protein